MWIKYNKLYYKERKFSTIRFDLFCLMVVGGVMAYLAYDQ